MSYFYGYPYDSGYAFYTQGPPQGKSQKIMYMVNTYLIIYAFLSFITKN